MSRSDCKHGIATSSPAVDQNPSPVVVTARAARIRFLTRRHRFVAREVDVNNLEKPRQHTPNTSLTKPLPTESLICANHSMPLRKVKSADKAIAIRHGDAPIRASKLPAVLRFPLLVLLSLTLSSLLYSFVAEYTEGDLASVSRVLDQWWEVGALVGWRTYVSSS